VLTDNKTNRNPITQPKAPMEIKRSAAQRITPIRRHAAFASVIAALAIAAPVTGARASTPRAAVQTSAGPAGSATGPTLIGDTFNGGTVIVTSPSPATATIVDSP
jgi:hypothetical protein